MTQQYPVINLAEAIAYQDDAVVSKTLVNKDAGIVTLFAFDGGQELSEHTSPYDAMVYMVEGTMDITISGQPKRVRGGEMIVMPANEPHALVALEKCKMLLVMIKS